MERRTKLEIINLILLAAEERTFRTLTEVTNSELGNKALTIYNKVRVRLLSEFPWPFALKRVPLQMADFVPISTWSFSYHKPVDFGKDWDLYANTPNYIYPSVYDFSIYKGYFALADEYGGSEARQEGPYIVSNITDLKMLYTSTAMTPETFETQFIRAMEYEGALELMRQRNTDPVVRAAITQELSKKEVSAKRTQSNSVPYKKKLGPTQMSARVFRGS